MANFVLDIVYFVYSSIIFVNFLCHLSIEKQGDKIKNPLNDVDAHHNTPTRIDCNHDNDESMEPHNPHIGIVAILHTRKIVDVLS